MEKLAAIYERKGVLFVMAAHRTSAGFWIDDDHVFCLHDSESEALGRAIEAALERSQDRVPTPPPSARIEKPLLTASNVGSWATFMKGSKHVSISSEEGALKLTPYRNLGSKEGFEPETVIAISPEPSAIGAAVLQALQNC